MRLKREKKGGRSKASDNYWIRIIHKILLS
jgi:hypothetical protein